MIPGLNDEVCRIVGSTSDQASACRGRVLRSTYSAGELATRPRSKIVSYEIRSSRSSFDHDNSITKGAVIVDGSPDMRELSVAELRTSHGVPQGINER